MTLSAIGFKFERNFSSLIGLFGFYLLGMTLYATALEHIMCTITLLNRRKSRMFAYAIHFVAPYQTHTEVFVYVRA